MRAHSLTHSQTPLTHSTIMVDYHKEMQQTSSYGSTSSVCSSVTFLLSPSFLNQNMNATSACNHLGGKHTMRYKSIALQVCKIASHCTEAALRQHHDGHRDSITTASRQRHTICQALFIGTYLTRISLQIPPQEIGSVAAYI